jgi:hypothetical protein
MTIALAQQRRLDELAAQLDELDPETPDDDEPAGFDE